MKSDKTSMKTTGLCGEIVFASGSSGWLGSENRCRTMAEAPKSGVLALKKGLQIRTMAIKSSTLTATVHSAYEQQIKWETRGEE